MKKLTKKVAGKTIQELEISLALLHSENAKLKERNCSLTASNKRIRKFVRKGLKPISEVVITLQCLLKEYLE